MNPALQTALETAWLWKLALACCAGLALLWWSVRGARRWRRLRSLRGALARVQDAAADAPATQALRDTFDQACAALQAAQPGAGRMALYHRPWVLFLGESDSRVGDLMHAAAPAAPSHGRLPRTFWRWHLLPQLVAIELDPLLVELPSAQEDSAQARSALARWYAALLLLAQRRSALPLDGIVLCVDAQQILRTPDAAADLAARLRRRADEASQHLRLRLPTQVLVTGLDRLPGYAPVRELLPEPMPAQAVGIRVPPGALLVIDDALDDLGNRLRALRMGLVRDHADAGHQLAVHRFFDQWLALQAGLSLLLKRLFAPGGAPYRLRGRGLYFVAAPGNDAQAPRAAFVDDLFGRFLPAERAFARLRR